MYCCTATVEAIGFRDAESASSLGCLPGAVYQGLSARGCFISLRPPLNLPGPPPCHPACRPRLCRSMCSCCWTAGRSSLYLGTTPRCWTPLSTPATATRAASELGAGRPGGLGGWTGWAKRAAVRAAAEGGAPVCLAGAVCAATVNCGLGFGQLWTNC